MCVSACLSTICHVCDSLCVWVQVCPCSRVPPPTPPPLTHPTPTPYCVVDIFKVFDIVIVY